MVVAGKNVSVPQATYVQDRYGVNEIPGLRAPE